MKRWDIPPNCGWFVYVLIYDNEVVYVGQSHSLHLRLGFHARKKIYNAVRVYEFDSADQMYEWEARLIRWFAPRLNTRGVPRELLSQRPSQKSSKGPKRKCPCGQSVWPYEFENDQWGCYAIWECDECGTVTTFSWDLPKEELVTA